MADVRPRWGASVATVTFVSSGAQLAIRLTGNNSSTLCEAARELKARYFIAVDGWDDTNDLPIWGVFDMRTAQKDTPMPGDWSINDPKLFPSNDAAVMWAIAMAGRN